MKSGTDANDGPGLVFAVAAAAGLGLAVAVSRLAYDGGTNGLTVATTRGLVLVAGLLGFCLLSGRRLRLAARDRLHCFGLGLLMSMMFYGNVGSVEFIPVGLAALLFYTFPPMIAAIQVLILGERIPIAKIVAIAIAFAGLCVMLGASLADSDPVGVSLALGAAVCVAWNSVWLTRKLSHVDPLVLTFHMSSVAALVLTVVTVGSGRLLAPVSATGWLGLVLTVVLQSASIPLFFLAMPRIGPLKTAMMSNVQPVVSIAAAFVLYAELLEPSQFVGGAMVLGAIGYMQQIDRRRHAIRTAVDRAGDGAQRHLGTDSCSERKE